MTITKRYKSYSIHDYIKFHLNELARDVVFFDALVRDKEKFALTDNEFKIYVQTFLTKSFKIGAHFNTDEFGKDPKDISKNLIYAWKEYLNKNDKEYMFTYNYYIELKK